MDYNFRDIEKKWQEYWKEKDIYRVTEDETKPKYYVLDMFPYPSGAGLHVGHPLGYIASDIFARYKRLNGFNVLHPMGYDAFGLPAEQYAIQTGQHPAVTTEKNINRYREQMDKLGFSYDWNREVRTCDPDYYKWTQWAFILMFNHWYNTQTQKPEPIENLIAEFTKNGNKNVTAHNNCAFTFTSAEWKAMDDINKQDVLMCYRIAYLGEAMVNWCPALGTVLANDEVKDGLSIRGGHAVIQKSMKQWQLRISCYAQRLLDGLDSIDWTESLKDIQRYWIGRSEGAEVVFKIKDSEHQLEIFTTRPDTLFGVTFMVLAPESELVALVTQAGHKKQVDEYLQTALRRSERERIAEVKKVTGVFSGSYALHPFTGEEIPIWISDYVIAGYGTGAIMAVPAHDQRDYDFAKHFDLPIRQVISGGDISQAAFDSKEGIVINSDFISGLRVPEAIKKITAELTNKKIGRHKINYRLRDAIFSRQRYWGEPFPVYYKNGKAFTIDEKLLPLSLPEVDAFLPTEQGEPPLARAKNWQTKDGHPYETSTMPGFAGSSAYYLRYMDPKNNNELVSKKANNYWRNVDLYIGGTEHATGHLIYSRFWNKFLFDLGYVCEEEPFKKLINQGMIQGRSNFVHRIKNTNIYISSDMIGKPIESNISGMKLINTDDTTAIHVDVNIVENDILDIPAFRNWSPDNKDAQFILNKDNQYVCSWAIEKMSKSMYNVVNPDTIVEKYGADTLRLYEMFLGPIEQSKPWDTNGIEGVHRFLKKFWRLFFNEQGRFHLTTEAPERRELKLLHQTISKISRDIETFSFNTAVSNFMICVNELTDIKCNKRDILEPLLILLSPFAPHICEELWQQSGRSGSIINSSYPQPDASLAANESHNYPIQFNGKLRFLKEFPLSMNVTDIEKEIRADENTIKWLDGKVIKKIIIVPGKIVNIVC